MHTDPILFVRETLPELFARGVTQLDGWRKEDVLAASGCVHVRFEGDAPESIWLSVSGGVLSVHDTQPAAPKTRFAIAIDRKIAEGGLEELERSGALEREDAAKRIAEAASARAEKAVDKEKPILFHLVLKNVPEVEQFSVKVGVGVADPPDKPGFTATVSYDSIEDFREGALTPQQLFMTKIKFVGDYSRAMALAMQLATPPKRPAP